MPEHDARNADEQVDPEFRRDVERLRAILSREWVIIERVENERRTQTLLLENLAGARTHRVLLRKDGRSFPLPQTCTELEAFVRQLIAPETGASWRNSPC